MEEAHESFIAGNGKNTASQTQEEFFGPLSSKTCAEEIERVCESCGDGACDCAGYEGLGGCGEGGRGEDLGRKAVEGKLDGAVCYLEEFGCDVIFPERLERGKKKVIASCWWWMTGMTLEE